MTDMTTTTTGTTRSQISGTRTNFQRFLLATRDLKQPFGAVVFTQLTTLVRFHELVRCTTTVAEGMLHVSEPHSGEGLAMGRVVPLPRAVQQILVQQTGPLTACLGIPQSRVGNLSAELRCVLAGLEQEYGPLEQLWPLAVQGAAAAAATARVRVAVLAFSGISPPGRRAAEERATLRDQDLQAVADLMDTLVVGAGFGLRGVADSSVVKIA